MTPDELRAQRVEKKARWRKKILDLAEVGEFYTRDLYEALTRDGEVFHRKQLMYQEAYKILQEMEDEGKLTSELRLIPKRISRRYYQKALTPAPPSATVFAL